MHRVVVSPHLDDAVLSAWSALRVPEGRVSVVTVFAGIPDAGRPATSWERACGVEDPRTLAQVRRAEDIAALRACGAGWVHLDDLDAVHRDQATLHCHLVDLLGDVCRDADEVWLPAAIGGHLDHVLVARAGLEATRSHDVVMYADQPYAVQWFPRPPAGEPAADLGWLATLVDASAFVPARPPEERVLGPEERRDKQRALAHYVTQLRGLGAAFPHWRPAEDPIGTEWWWPVPARSAGGPPLRLLPSPPAHGAACDAGAPFLTVITRTQGRRADPLRQMLESLAAQTSRDFELVVVTHDPDPEGEAVVDRALAAVPEWLRRRTIRHTVSGGPPARPLNAALELATGRYVVALDDDDEVLGDWVAEFARLEERHPEHVLRARVMRRTDGVGSPDATLFAEGFDLLEHLAGNQTPICGVAFPRAWIERLGFAFDEDVAVLEDWAALLTLAPLCGVAASTRVTSAYWDRGLGDDSRARHSQDAFTVATRHVVERADARPLLLPPGSVSALRERRRQLLAAREEAARSSAELAQAKEDLAALEEAMAAQACEAAQRLDAAERQAARVADEAAREAAVLAERLAAADLAYAELERAFVTSTSWRVTWPMRAVAASLQRALGQGRSPKR